MYFIGDGPLPNATQSIVAPSLPEPQGQPARGMFVNGSFVFSYNATVTYTQNTTVCNPNGLQTVVIVFDTIHGQLPKLIPDYSTLFDNVNGNRYIYLCACLRVYVSTYMCVCVYMCVCPSVYPSVCLPVCPSVCVCVCLSVHLSV